MIASFVWVVLLILCGVGVFHPDTSLLSRLFQLAALLFICAALAKKFFPEGE